MFGVVSEVPLVDIADDAHIVRMRSSSGGTARPAMRLKAVAWRDADHALRDQADGGRRLGLMFWFNRNRLLGSYRSVRATNRSYFASP